MSVLLLKAGIPLLLGIVRYGPKPAIGKRNKEPRLFDHLVGGSAQAERHVRPSAFAAFMLITNSNLLACTTGSSAGLAPVSTRPAETPIAPFDDAGFRETLVERGH